MIDTENLYTRTVGDEMIEMDIEFEDLHTLGVTENPSESMDSMYQQEKPIHHTEILVNSSPLVAEHQSPTIELYEEFMYELVSWCYQSEEQVKLKDLQHYLGYFIPNITTIKSNLLDGKATHKQSIENIIQDYQKKDKFNNMFVLVAFSGVRALITILNTDKRNINTDRFRVDTDDEGNLETPNINGETETDLFEKEFSFTIDTINNCVTKYTDSISIVFTRHPRYSEFIGRIITGLGYSPVTSLDEAIGACEQYLQIPITGQTVTNKPPSQFRVVCDTFPDIYVSIFCYYLRLYRFVQE